MVFFTRKGLTVPEFPALNAAGLDEEDAADICVPTIPPLPLCHAPAYNSARHNTTAAPTYSESVAALATTTTAIVKETTINCRETTPTPSVDAEGTPLQPDDAQYDYVVDRTLGVEVWIHKKHKQNAIIYSNDFKMPQININH